jgi:predicted deacetylase
VSRKSISVDEGTALLSVHHVTPEYEDAVIQTCDRLDELGIKSFTLLIIPFFQMKRSNTFEKHELFAEYLKSLGLELSMHGYAHQTKSGGDAEFLRMPYEQIASRMKIGVSLMKRGLDEGPVGFIPPLWTAPQALIRVSKELKLRYCVIGDVVYDLLSDVRLSTAYHIIGTEGVSSSRASAILELELGGPVQVSLHPKAFVAGGLRDLLVDMQDRLEYKFVGYNEFLNSKQSAS